MHRPAHSVSSQSNVIIDQSISLESNQLVGIWRIVIGMMIYVVASFSHIQAAPDHNTHVIQPAPAEETIRLQLSWQHRFQFAGFYAAKYKNFYKKEGLNVELLEKTNNHSPIQQVVNGVADYGVADSALLLHRSKNRLLTIVAPIFQHSPQVLFTTKRSGINNIFDLNYKRVGFYAKDTDSLSLILMFKELGITPNIVRYPNNFDAETLQTDKIDAFSGYFSPQLVNQDTSKTDGILSAFQPKDYGVNLYGDMLFTTNKEAQNNPQRLQAFTQATLKGWEYALENPKEVAKYIQRHYAPELSLNALLAEAALVEQAIDRHNYPLGNLDPGRIQYTQNLLVKHHLTQNSDLHYVNNLSLNDHRTSFTPGEIEWLKKHQTVKVAIDTHWAPLEFVDDAGNFVGIAPKFLEFISHQTGIEFQPATDLTWSEAVQQMQQGKLDMYSAVSYTPERASYSLYTQPYLNFPMVIATQRYESFISDLAKLSDKTIAVVKDYASHEFMRTTYPNIELKLVDNPKQGVEAVSKGEVYGYVDNVAIITHYINTNHFTNIQISGETPFHSDVHMAVRKDWPELQSIINKVIDSMTEAQRAEITDAWLKITYQQVFMWKEFLWVAIPILLSIAIVSYYNLRLKRMNSNLRIAQKSLEKTNRALSGLSVTDHLTGVYNRKHLDKILHQEMERANRYGQEFAILIMDLDFFKQVNDNHGHLVGDEVLITFSSWIHSIIRSSDTLGRWGGEEFMLICPNTTAQQAYQIGEKICIGTRLQTYPNAIKQTVSIGVTAYLKQQSAEQLLEKADDALYIAKQNGRNQVVIM